MRLHAVPPPVPPLFPVCFMRSAERRTIDKPGLYNRAGPPSQPSPDSWSPVFTAALTRLGASVNANIPQVLRDSREKGQTIGSQDTNRNNQSP